MLNSSNIAFILLKTGIKIVSEIVDMNDQDVVISHPMEIIAVDDMMSGRSGYTFIEWIPSAFTDTQEITITKSETFLISTPTKALVNSYLKVSEMYGVGNISEAPIAKPDSPNMKDSSMSEYYEFLLKNLAKQTAH